MTQASNSSAFTVTTLNVNSLGTVLTSSGSSLFTVTNLAGTGGLTLYNNGAGGITLGGANNTGAIINSGNGVGTVTFNGAIGVSVSSVTENSPTSGLVFTHASSCAALNVFQGTVTGGNNGLEFSLGAITLGGSNTANNATLTTQSAGSQSFGNQIWVASGDSGALTISMPGQNNTYSGAIGFLSGGTSTSNLTVSVGGGVRRPYRRHHGNGKPGSE